FFCFFKSKLIPLGDQRIVYIRRFQGIFTLFQNCDDGGSEGSSAFFSCLRRRRRRLGLFWDGDSTFRRRLWSARRYCDRVSALKQSAELLFECFNLFRYFSGLRKG